MPLHQDEEAAAAIRAHHVELRDTLLARGGDQRDAVRAGRPHEESEHAVMGSLEDDLLPHAAADAAALYPVGDTGLTVLLVRAMREELVSQSGCRVPVTAVTRAAAEPRLHSALDVRLI